MSNPYEPPSHPSGPDQDSGDLLPESLRLRGYVAVTTRRALLAQFAWVMLAAGAAVAYVGWRNGPPWLVACGAGAVIAAYMMQRPTTFRAPTHLRQRWSTLREVHDFEAAAAEASEPWRALLLLDAANRRLSNGDVDHARRYLLAIERSGWLTVFPALRYLVVDGLGLIDALEGRLEEAEARFRSARAEAPPAARPYLRGTDIVVHLRRGDAAAARRALEDREREFLEQPLPDQGAARPVDEMRALLTACILRAEEAAPEDVDRELARAKAETLLGWSAAWPALRPLAQRATELLPTPR